MSDKKIDLLETGTHLQNLAENLLEAIAAEDHDKVETLEGEIHTLVEEVTASISMDRADLRTLGEAVRSLGKAVEDFETKPSDKTRDQLDKSLIRLVYAQGKRLE